MKINYFGFFVKRKLALGFIIFFVFSLFTFFYAIAADAPYSPQEKLILMRERILRDLDKAKEIRGLAMSQKGRLQEIMKEAQSGQHSSNINQEVYEKVLAAAPANIKRTEEALAETEKLIRGLTLKLAWTERTLNNLAPEKPAAVGFGFSMASYNLANVKLLRHGQEKIIPLGKDQFLPGDEIITDKYGKTRLGTSGAVDVIVTVGAGTRLKYERDNLREGTVWKLQKGIIHCAPLTEGITGRNPLIVTSDAIIQGEEGSEYDVRIDESGQVFVEVYRGKAEVKETQKGTSYFSEAGTGTVMLPRWWEKDEYE